MTSEKKKRTAVSPILLGTFSSTLLAVILFWYDSAIFKNSILSFIAVIFLCATTVFGCWIIWRLLPLGSRSLVSSWRASKVSSTCTLLAELLIGCCFATVISTHLLFYICLFGKIKGSTQLMICFAGLVIGLFLIYYILVASVVSLCKRFIGSRAKLVYTVILAVVASLLVALIVYLVNDDATIENDYTLSDIRAPENSQSDSHFTLLTYQKGETNKIQVSPWGKISEETGALGLAEEIENAWIELKEARLVMEKLDSFDAIADLAEPRWDMPMISFVSYRNIAQTYWAYAGLRMQQKRFKEAAITLAQLQSVLRKVVPYSKTLVRKMVCISLLNINTEQIRFLLKQCPNNDIIEIIKPVCSPIPKDDLSLRGPIISEYIVTKKFSEGLTFVDVGYMQEYESKPVHNSMLLSISSLLTPIVYNKNKTIGKLLRVCDGTLEAVEKDQEYDCEIYASYSLWRLKNPMGYLLIHCSTLSYSNLIESILKTKAISDMLAVEFNHRLGLQSSLKDPYKGKHYMIDEKTGSASCASLDGVHGTKDDLRLRDSQWR